MSLLKPMLIWINDCSLVVRSLDPWFWIYLGVLPQKLLLLTHEFWSNQGIIKIRFWWYGSLLFDCRLWRAPSIWLGLVLTGWFLIEGVSHRSLIDFVTVSDFRGLCFDWKFIILKPQGLVRFNELIVGFRVF